MHRLLSVVAGFGVLAFLSPTPIQAQDHRFGAGYNVGAVWFSPLNASAPNIGGDPARDIELDLGWVVGLQLEQWFGGGRIGGRLSGAMTERPMVVPGRSPRDIGVWMADASVLLRIVGTGRDTRVAPFVAAGVGLVHYSLGSGDVLSYVPAGAAYDGDDSARFAPSASFGIDIMTGWRWDTEPIGIRIEGTDHIVLESPFRSLSSGKRLGLIHNARVTLGVFTGFGVLQ